MKKHLCLFVIILFANLCYAQFITTWKSDGGNTSAAGKVSTSTQIQFPVALNSGSYSGTWVKAGDASKTGTFSFPNVTSGTVAHVIDFGEVGTYEVLIDVFTPTTFKFAFNNAGDRNKLLEVKKWGNIEANTQGMFYGCTYLDVTASDIPVIKNAAYMFTMCSTLKGNANFNNWDVGEVTSMIYMFTGTSLFNQPLGNWNTSKVTSMRNMFQNSSLFNQELTTDGNKWNVSLVSNFNDMFNNATSFNNSSIGTWTLKAGVTINNFVTTTDSEKGIDCVNYGKILDGWAKNSATPSSLVLSTNRKRSGALANAAYNTLTTTKSWAITDVVDANCFNVLPVTLSGLTAIRQNNSILVKWETISEQNNDYFDIEYSYDGKEWKLANRVLSKAINGSSDTKIQYEKSINLKDQQLAGISIFATMLLVILLFNRKKPMFISMLIVCGIGLSNCSKDADQPSEDREVYIRLIQVDRNGETGSLSDVVHLK